MKIAITGHTSGIGKALFDRFRSKDNEVIGFSRSNGYDISDPDARKKILEEVKDFDVFVNNAYNDTDSSQYFLLKEIFDFWTSKEKTIINISSLGVYNRTNKYCQTKLEQDIFCNNNIFSNYPRIINIKPGLVDTPRVSHRQGYKMSPEYVANIIEFCLTNSVRTITFGLDSNSGKKAT